MTRREFREFGAPDLVYVRKILGRELLGSASLAPEARDMFSEDSILYAVHSASGERLAVLIDREAAFAAAAAHELVAMSVH